MTSLFWPGDERAGDLMSDTALLAAMVRVEHEWLQALVATGIAPREATADLTSVVTTADVQEVALGAESGGNPAIAVVPLLRSRVESAPALWLHRGLTSQDVVDTALILVVRDVLDRLGVELRTQIATAADLAEGHARTPMTGRTLTQQAAPTTFGAAVASWLDGIVDAAESVAAARARLGVQLGGAVGTRAASVELAALRGLPDPEGVAGSLVQRTAAALQLPASRPWHTSRGQITRTGDALVSCTDAWGHLATDVATLSRNEIGELSESSAGGRGGSSTMPHKRNPVLSVLVRRAALAAPALGSTLHLASGMSGDQRPDGAWHVEWQTLQLLCRRSVVAASQTSELLQGLHVDTNQMSETLSTATDGVLAERRSLTDLFGVSADLDPHTYLGTAPQLALEAAHRGRAFLKESS